MEIVLIFLIVCLAAAGYTIYNLLSKLEKYEDMVEETDNFIQSELQKNEALLEALRQIDNRQMFEKDDDVGSIFYQIKETIEKFKQR
jgi:DNA-binding ferritin-like protein